MPADAGRTDPRPLAVTLVLMTAAGALLAAVWVIATFVWGGGGPVGSAAEITLFVALAGLQAGTVLLALECARVCSRPVAFALCAGVPVLGCLAAGALLVAALGARQPPPSPSSSAFQP